MFRGEKEIQNPKKRPESVESNPLVGREQLPELRQEEEHNVRHAVRRRGFRDVVAHVVEDHVVTTRQNAATEQARANHPVWRVTKYAATTLLESIPGGLGPWGIGDVITAVEAFTGRTIDGKKLSLIERGIYLFASAIPVVPARPFVTAYEVWHKKRVEPHITKKPQH